MGKVKKENIIEVLGENVKTEDLKSSVQRIIGHRRFKGPIEFELRLSEEDKKRHDPTTSYYNVYRYAFFD
ncbi:MAG: hypothetical protein EAX81_06870 [Candidatus Thorarchaeota archaeon]|nr:hypothetical protein [Candidatus Thorarchaeota archaeon]